jgi:hypothetical protein
MREEKLLDPIVDVSNVAKYEWFCPDNNSSSAYILTFCIVGKKKEIDIIGAQGVG